MLRIQRGGFHRTWGDCLWAQPLQVSPYPARAPGGSGGFNGTSLAFVLHSAVGREARIGEALFKEPTSPVINGVADTMLICGTRW